MPIPNYSVLRGSPIAGRIIAGHGPHDEPHYHIHVQANGADYDIAVNVKSTDGSEVLYLVNNSFTPPNAQAIAAVAEGVTLLASGSNIALDYVRVPGLVSRSEMSLLPIGEASPTSAHTAVDTVLQRAITSKATMFVFGQAFSSGAGSRNPFFGFSPDQGSHDVHMNQGNPVGPHGGSNGTFQDGGIFISFPDGTWSALFFAFQSQSFQTDDNGNPA